MPLARGLPPRLSPTARTLGECCKRGTLTGLPLALGARAFSSTREEGNLGVKAPTTTLLGPKRLWIIIVNIIIIIIIVGWALRACVILRGLGRALGPSAKATSKDYRALRR